MKRILKRSTLILVFTLLFIGGASFFCVELVFNADDWANQPYNAHSSGNGGLEQAGAVYDRNGTVLVNRYELNTGTCWCVYTSPLFRKTVWVWAWRPPCPLRTI